MKDLFAYPCAGAQDCDRSRSAAADPAQGGLWNERHFVAGERVVRYCRRYHRGTGDDPLNDQMDDLAMRFANEAMAEAEDATEAMAVLFQAAAAIFATHYPIAAAPEGFARLAAEMGQAMSEAYGVKASKQ